MELFLKIIVAAYGALILYALWNDMRYWWSKRKPR